MISIGIGALIFAIWFVILFFEKVIGFLESFLFHFSGKSDIMKGDKIGVCVPRYKVENAQKEEFTQCPTQKR